MIPPIRPSILVANPQFALLHSHLTTHLLNPDASTQSTATQYEETANKLKQHHIRTCQNDILKRTLLDTVTDNETLPPELAELIVTIAVYLTEAPNMALSDEAHDLMTPEVEAFQQNLHTIAPILSSSMQCERDSSLPLAASPLSPTSTSSITKPTNNTTTTTTTTTTKNSQQTSPTSPTPLSQTLTARLTTLQHLESTILPKHTTNLTTTLSTLLTAHTTHLTSLIRHLELHTHGTLSRHTTARATYLSTVAAGLDAKLRILSLQARHALYTPATQRALSTYSAHLAEFRARLLAREEMLTAELDSYEEKDEDGGAEEELRECARRDGAVGREIEVIKGEIARLEDKVGEYGIRRR